MAEVHQLESLEGYLLMADFSQMHCRLHLPSGDTIHCEFDLQLMNTVKAALLTYVGIEGIVDRKTATKAAPKAKIKHLKILDPAVLSYPFAEDIEEDVWLLAASRNPVFQDLHDPEEDIYSLNDGKPFHD